MAQIDIRHLCKSFGTTEVLHDIGLTVKDAELTVLLGPSGCGKSTLLRMIAGIEEITAGDILIDGVRVNDLEPKKRGCALVFQNYALYPHKKVYDNIAFPLAMAHERKSVIDERVQQAARLLQLEPYLDRLPRDLSGGQRQRVAMGRAIVRQPKAFLFDEPLSNLDAELRVRMRLEIARLQRQLGATMIFVTHDQVEAMTLAQKIVVMRDGNIEQEGAPRDVYRDPANRFVAQFVGMPAMNMLAVEASESDAGGFCITLAGGVRLPLPIRLDGEPATLGVRSEHVRVVPGGDGALRFPAEACEIIGAEHLGDRSYVYLATPLGDLVTLQPPEAQLDLSAGLAVDFDPDGIHMFDADGRTLARQPAVQIAAG